MAAHEDAIAAMRSKHSKAVDELNEQLESAKKVRLEIQPFMYTTEKLCYNNGRMLSCLFLGRIAHVRFLHNLCTHFLHMTTGSLVLHFALSTSLFAPPSLSLSLFPSSSFTLSLSLILCHSPSKTWRKGRANWRERTSHCSWTCEICGQPLPRETRGERRPRLSSLSLRQRTPMTRPRSRTSPPRMTN